MDQGQVRAQPPRSVDPETAEQPLKDTPSQGGQPSQRSQRRGSRKPQADYQDNDTSADEKAGQAVGMFDQVARRLGSCQETSNRCQGRSKPTRIHHPHLLGRHLPPPAQQQKVAADRQNGPAVQPADCSHVVIGVRSHFVCSAN